MEALTRKDDPRWLGVPFAHGAAPKGSGSDPRDSPLSPNNLRGGKDRGAGRRKRREEAANEGHGETAPASGLPPPHYLADYAVLPELNTL